MNEKIDCCLFFQKSTDFQTSLSILYNQLRSIFFCNIRQEEFPKVALFGEFLLFARDYKWAFLMGWKER